MTTNRDERVPRPVMVRRHARGVHAVPDIPPDIPDVPASRQSLRDLRGLSDDLEILVRAVRDLVALRDELDAGLHPRGAGRTVSRTPFE